LDCDRQFETNAVVNEQFETNAVVNEQFETNAVVNEQFETKPGRKSKYPWKTLTPQICQWRHEGKSVRAIAKALHMPYSSLENKLYRK
jgi:hypothetical protein